MKSLNFLRSFRSVVNRNELTEEAYTNLLKLFGFENLDLNAEMEKINQKKSYLSRSNREAVIEFNILRNILNKQKETEQASISFNNDNLHNNERLIGGDVVSQ